jgi:hypothetical protein
MVIQKVIPKLVCLRRGRLPRAHSAPRIRGTLAASAAACSNRRCRRSRACSCLHAELRNCADVDLDRRGVFLTDLRLRRLAEHVVDRELKRFHGDVRILAVQLLLPQSRELFFGQKCVAPLAGTSCNVPTGETGIIGYLWRLRVPVLPAFNPITQINQSPHVASLEQERAEPRSRKGTVMESHYL